VGTIILEEYSAFILIFSNVRAQVSRPCNTVMCKVEHGDAFIER
jgi:hypothetical protein